jgi:hypothetical protein
LSPLQVIFFIESKLYVKAGASVTVNVSVIEQSFISFITTVYVPGPRPDWSSAVGSRPDPLDVDHV